MCTCFQSAANRRKLTTKLINQMIKNEENSTEWKMVQIVLFIHRSNKCQWIESVHTVHKSKINGIKLTCFGSNDKLNKKKIEFFQDNNLCAQENEVVVKMVSAQVGCSVFR